MTEAPRIRGEKFAGPLCPAGVRAVRYSASAAQVMRRYQTWDSYTTPGLLAFLVRRVATPYFILWLRYGRNGGKREKSPRPPSGW
jgi:hypothetical protein